MFLLLRESVTGLHTRYLRFSLAVLVIVCAVPLVCTAQSYRSLCIRGDGKFQATSRTHIAVAVGAARNESFGARVCRAELMWEKQSLVVADQAAEIDLDLFGVNLEGLGPVAAFNVKKSADQCCMEYRIFALDGNVRLLRTLHGGSFTGADTDLDGRVEIWAEDRAAIDGLDGLTLAEIEHPPTYVLRFEQGRLLDATPAFQDHFDQMIETIRQSISADDLEAFRKSDGVPRFSLDKLDQWRKLRAIKVRVLEIVWAYLYSGREKTAWATLKTMWPETDAERIETALKEARSRGILTQIEGISIPPPNKPKPSRVYAWGEVTQAVPIHIWRSPAIDAGSVVDEEQSVDVVIDSAGKVHSVKWSVGKKPPGDDLLTYVQLWKFIPAFKGGQPVASQRRLMVSPNQ